MKRLKSIFNKYWSMLLEPVIGYTRVVFATKFLLLFFAFLLLLALILIPVLRPDEDDFRLTFSSIETGGVKGPDPVMIRPRFQGIDEQNRTYSVNAATATKKDDEILVLDNIHADVNLKDHSWISLVANNGIFNYKKKTLAMNGYVSVFTNDGYEFYTDEVFVDIDENYAYGEKPMQGMGPMGSIKADSFYVYNRGERVVFKGGVSILLYPDGSYEKLIK